MPDSMSIAGPPGSAGAGLTLERASINLSWYLKLRWAAALGQILTVGIVSWGLGIELPLLELALVVGASVLISIGLDVWFRRRGCGTAAGRIGALAAGRETRRLEVVLALVVAADILLLTGLLFVSGGPTNPFAIFYLANVTLSAVVLEGAWAWSLGALSFACFLGLYFFHRPLAVLGDVGGGVLVDLFRDPGSLDPTRLYLGGRLVAFGAVSAILVHFITRLTSELWRRDVELRGARQRRAQTEKLEALGTLAAGAAHELASPLSTIAVIARDLELHLADLDVRSDVVEDVQLIRDEIGRCRRILDDMAMGAGETAGEELAAVSVAALAERVLAEIPDGAAVESALPAGVRDVRIFAPQKALARAIRAVVRNAIDASERDSPVEVRWGVSDGELRIEVRDRGHGMTPAVLERAADPFFTTKDPGRGMGLGLSISKAVIDRLGGTLRIRSASGSGTTAEISVPLEADVPEAAR